MKTCSCGRQFETVPKDAKLSTDSILPGYYFNCECKSTIVWPLSQVRKEKFHNFKNHLVIGKSYKRLNKEEMTFCEMILEDTVAMDDNKFAFTVNRLGVCSHPEFLKFRHSTDMWALLLQSINIDKQIRRRRE